MASTLNSEQTHLLTEAISHLRGKEFARALLHFMRSVVNFDSAVTMSYPDD